VRLHKFIVITTLVVFLLLAAVAWFFPSTDDFGVENELWNGMSKTLVAEFRPLKSLDDLPAESTLLLIPYSDFSTAELERIKDFVSQGGNLILADDYGYGNKVLEYLGLNERFSGAPLLDPLVNYKHAWFPRILHIRDSALTTGVTSLVLNHATALTYVAPGDVIASSSAFSFLDLSGNEESDSYDPAGSFPVISRHPVSSGQVILIADPSIFINSMNGLEDNKKLIKNIVALSTTPPFIDQSHLTPSNLRETKGLLADARGILSSPLGTLGAVVLALGLTLMPFWRERRQP